MKKLIPAFIAAPLFAHSDTSAHLHPHGFEIMAAIVLIAIIIYKVRGLK